MSDAEVIPDIIVSGQLCMDVIPVMGQVSQAAINTPGHLAEAGPLLLVTGGAASNVGMALFRLGILPGLMGAVGDDAIGQMTLNAFASHDPVLIRWIRVRHGQPGSYTLALSPENRDRMFLYYPATNATYGPEDVDFEVVSQAKLFYLGYPPLLARMWQDGGTEQAHILQRVKAAGVVTAVDMARPDPAAPVGQIDWRAVIARTLPYIDIFVPSIEEILFMLHRADLDAWGAQVYAHLSLAYLDDLAAELLDMGAVVAGFKLGEMGLYLRITDDTARLRRLEKLPVRAADWAGARVYHPAFQVQVAGTTGAGDSAFAGLLAAMLTGYGPQETVRLACAVGAYNVEHLDSNSGIRPWHEVEMRLQQGWPTRTEPVLAEANPHP